MNVEAQQLQTWIGAEVLDRSARGSASSRRSTSAPTCRSWPAFAAGLWGQSANAVLRGATVSRNSLHLGTAAALVADANSERVGVEELATLAGQDDRLQDAHPGNLEGWHARVERLAAEAKASEEADKLAAEASRSTRRRKPPRRCEPGRPTVRRGTRAPFARTPTRARAKRAPRPRRRADAPAERRPALPVRPRACGRASAGGRVRVESGIAHGLR